MDLLRRAAHRFSLDAANQAVSAASIQELKFSDVCGEILKVIGDGLIAVFPVKTEAAEASRAAIAAAKDAIARRESSNRRLPVASFAAQRPNPAGTPFCRKARYSSRTIDRVV
jgi:class 3 adenylate cyclase